MSGLINSAFGLLVAIAAIITLGLTGNLFSASPFVIAAQVLAVGLSVWARRSFPDGTFRVTAAPGGESIITRGPYRMIRHPMYAAVLIFIWAAVLSHRSLLTVLIGIVVTSVIVARVIAEEKLLRAHYPDYREYTKSTRALIPYIV